MSLEIESSQSYYEQRVKDIQFLKNNKIDPYPHYYKTTNSIKQLRRQDSYINDGEHKEDKIYRTSGRVTLKRASGKKLVFYTLEDDNFNIQIMASATYYKDTSLSFNDINNTFSSLFKKLFNGGKAYLELIDSSDPLQAGLDLLVSPPGKKFQKLALQGLYRDTL